MSEVHYSDESSKYKARDCVGETVKIGAGSALAGVAFSIVSNAYQTHKFDKTSVFTRTGSSVKAFGLVGVTYSATYCLMSNMRQKQDHWSSGTAGAVAGATLGLLGRSFPIMVGAAAAIGATMWVYDYTGGTVRGPFDGVSYEEREMIRKTYLKAD
ncbi:hypothetical protein BDF22DRAFT_777570 [Syncephalis plumigaleata]|nr:hypothetical protein BDF22DRAFT_777570 [Syncephalis plumigaleata]